MVDVRNRCGTPRGWAVVSLPSESVLHALAAPTPQLGKPVAAPCHPTSLRPCSRNRNSPDGRATPVPEKPRTRGDDPVPGWSHAWHPPSAEAPHTPG